MCARFLPHGTATPGPPPAAAHLAGCEHRLWFLPDAESAVRGHPSPLRGTPWGLNQLIPGESSKRCLEPGQFLTRSSGGDDGGC